MKSELKSDKRAKDLLFKFLSVLVIASAAMVLFNVMSQDKDGRSQIVDNDGGTEYIGESEAVISATQQEQRLGQILSQIKGVGKVEVMITYNEEEAAAQTMFSTTTSDTPRSVQGVIVVAEGAGNPVVQNYIINAVTSAFDISTSSVMVFEKEK